MEGGARVHGALLDAGLVDRVELFVAPRILADAAAPSFAAGRGKDAMRDAWELRDVQLRTRGPDVWWSGRPVAGGASHSPDEGDSLGPRLSFETDEG